MNTQERIEELQETRDEFILNESVFEDDHPSWGELAEAQAIAESKWGETDDGKELKALLSKAVKIGDTIRCIANTGKEEWDILIGHTFRVVEVNTDGEAVTWIVVECDGELDFNGHNRFDFMDCEFEIVEIKANG